MVAKEWEWKDWIEYLILVGVTGLCAFVKTHKTMCLKRANFPGGKLPLVKLEYENIKNKHDVLRKVSIPLEIKKPTYASDLTYNKNYSIWTER